MRRAVVTTAVLSAASAVLFACGLVFDVDALGPREAREGADATAPSAVDAGGGAPPADADADAGSSALLDAGGDGRGPTGLDERVALPDLSGAPCDVQGGIQACPRPYACRFATPDSGRCDPCPDTLCEGGVGTRCTLASDCDVSSTCFRGYCTSSCILGGPECGPIDACLPIGYEGDVGLCDPRIY